MEVSILSHEFIMPSCETPEHPKTHLMSFFDQIAPSSQMPFIFFYSFGDDAGTPEIHVDDMIKKRLESLKQSLSKTLASFYPLAGRLSDDKNSIVCSDEGVYFAEASVNSNLSNFIQRHDLLHKLLPADATDNNVASVQVTRFTCGGMAIGTLISHKIADACSYAYFLRSWAATTKDDREPHKLSTPNFDGSKYFPQTDTTSPDLISMIMPFFKRARSATRRFVFDAEAILALKAKASSSTCKRSPSRVEAVSTVIFKSMAAAMKARSGKPKPIFTTYLVNIRRRAMPSLPESCMGNYVGIAPAALGIIGQDTELSDLVIKMREEITKKYTCDFVKSLQSEPENLWEIRREIGEVAAGKEVEYIGFNSLCNLGIYDVDFGWGKPMWVANQSVLFQFADDYINTACLMDTRSNYGVEASITLHEEEMAIFEQDIKAFIASVAPKPEPTTVM